MLDWLSVKTNRIFTFGSHKLMVSAIANHDDTAKDAYIWLAGDNGYTKSVHVTQAAKSGVTANLFALNVSNSVPNSEMEHETDQIGDNGQTITITSLDIPGWRFVQWKGYFIQNGNISGEFQFSDPTAMSVSFTMPNSDIKIVAMFERRKYKLIVNENVVGEYLYESEVTFTAGGSNQSSFKRWISIVGIDPPEDMTDPTLEFTMSANNVELKYLTQDELFDVFVDDRRYGSYKPGEIVRIAATSSNILPFVQWTATGITLTDPTNESLVFEMPANEVRLNREYENKRIVSITIDGVSRNAYACFAGETVTIGLSGDYDIQLSMLFDTDTYTFDKWLTTSGIEMFANPLSAEQTFVMPDTNVNLSVSMTQQKFQLTIDGVSRMAQVGEIIQATADPPSKVGTTLDWKVEEGNITLSNPSSPTISFVMPARNVTINSRYILNKYTITYRSSTTGYERTQSVLYTLPVTISCLMAPNQAFDNWVSCTGIDTFQDMAAEQQSFTMPANDIVLVYNSHQVAYTLQIDDTTTQVPAGTRVTQTASSVTGKTFRKWTVVSGGVTLEDDTNSTLSFVMPSNDVTIRSEYDISSFNVTIERHTTIDGEDVIIEQLAPVSKLFESAVSLTATSAIPYTKQDNSNTHIRFTEWASNDSSVSVDNETKNLLTFSFTMPAHDVVLKTYYNTETYLDLENITEDTRTSTNDASNLLNVVITEDEYGNYTVGTPVPCIEFKVLTDMFGVSYEKIVSDINVNAEWSITAVDSFGVTRAIPSNAGTTVNHAAKEYISDQVTENDIAKFGLTQTAPETTQSRSTTFSIRNNLSDCKFVRRVTVPFLGKAVYDVTVAQNQGIADTTIDNNIKSITLNADTRELILNCSATNCFLKTFEIDSTGTELEKSSNFLSGSIENNESVSGQKIIRLQMYPNVYENSRVLKCRVVFSTWTHGFTPTTETVEIRLTQPVAQEQAVAIDRITGTNILTLEQTTDPDNNSLVVYTPGNYDTTSPMAVYTFNANVPFELRTTQTNMSLYQLRKETVVCNPENETAHEYLIDIIANGYPVYKPEITAGENNTEILTYYTYSANNFNPIQFTNHYAEQSQTVLYKKSATFYPTKNETQTYCFGLVLTSRNTANTGGYFLGTYDSTNGITEHSLLFQDVFSEVNFSHQDFYALTGAETFNIKVNGIDTEDWDDKLGVDKTNSSHFTDLTYTTDENGIKHYQGIPVVASGSYLALNGVPPWKQKITSSLVPAYVIPTNAYTEVYVISSTGNAASWTKASIGGFSGNVGANKPSISVFENATKNRMLVFGMLTSPSASERYAEYRLRVTTACEPLNAILPINTDERFTEMSCYFKITQGAATNYGLTNISIGGANNHAIADNNPSESQSNIVLHKNTPVASNTTLNTTNDQSRTVEATYTFTTNVAVLIVPTNAVNASTNMTQYLYRLKNTTNNTYIEDYVFVGDFPNATMSDFLPAGTYTLEITALENDSVNEAKQVGSFAIYDENFYTLKNILIYQLGIASVQNVLIRAMNSSKQYAIAASSGGTVFKLNGDAEVATIRKAGASATASNNSETTKSNPNYGFLITARECITTYVGGTSNINASSLNIDSHSTFTLPKSKTASNNPFTITNTEKTQQTKWALFKPGSMTSDGFTVSVFYQWTIQTSTGNESLDNLLSKNINDNINTATHSFVVEREAT